MCCVQVRPSSRAVMKWVFTRTTCSTSVCSNTLNHVHCTLPTHPHGNTSRISSGCDNNIRPTGTSSQNREEFLHFNRFKQNNRIQMMRFSTRLPFSNWVGDGDGDDDCNGDCNGDGDDDSNGDGDGDDESNGAGDGSGDGDSNGAGDGADDNNDEGGGNGDGDATKLDAYFIVFSIDWIAF